MRHPDEVAHMNRIGLDLGTTGVKALLLPADGGVPSLAYREYPLLHPRIGWAELRPLDVLTAVREVLTETAPRLTRSAPSVIAISSQAQAVVPVAKDFTPLDNIIVTMDGRTIPQYEWWRDSVDAWAVYQKTGTPFSSISTVNKIMWHKANNPGLYERAWKFCCVQDFVLGVLCGEALIDYSLAGRTMMFNPRLGRWDEDVLALAGLKVEKLSRPVPSTTVAGTLRPGLAGEIGIPAATRIVVGGHDQCCGALGAGVNRPGLAMNALGTVDALVVVGHEFTASTDLMNRCLPCYPYVIPNAYVSMAINTSNGIMLQWFRDTLCGEECSEAVRRRLDPYAHIIDSAADTPADLFVLPHLQGADIPAPDPYSAAAFIGLRATTDKSQMIRAVLDSLSYEMKQNIVAFEENGHSIREIRAIGGGAKSAKWLQIKADIYQKPVVSMQVGEAAALGAAILGGIGAGFYRSADDAVEDLVRPGVRYEPDARHSGVLETRFAEYRRLYPALRDVNHLLSERIRRQQDV
jgi:xylulokinase